MRRRTLYKHALRGAALLALGAGQRAFAQSASGAPARWAPNRPLRLVVPFAAGGPADIFGRVFAEALAAQLGQPVVVDNRTGAGGVIGTDAAAKAAPDGHTLALTGPGALSIAPALPQRMPFDVYRDLAHLSLVVRVPEVLVVNPASGHAALAELVAAARAKPGGLSFGSAGVGSITHLAGALLAKETGMEVAHVPYRGIAPATTDLLAGRIAFVVADIPVLRPHIEAGALRPLAVTTARRIRSLAEVPTTAELGFPRVVSDNWYGLAAPAATPAPVLDRLREATAAALRTPELAREFERHGGEPAPMTGEAYLAFLREEAAKWGPLVRETGAEAL
jgi:tripartite-type tricarboxylate transporter receptor subunit TctC